MSGSKPVTVMIWNAARGGMRSVVEAYRDDGFLDHEQVMLIASYVDGGVVKRQLVLIGALLKFLVVLIMRRVDLVHIHAAMRGSFWRKGLFASLARLFGVPVILHLHGSEFKGFYASQSAALQRAIRRHLEKATRVLVLSESWERYITEIAPAARIIVVPNYVTVPPLLDERGRDTSRLLFLGLVGQRKGVFDLIPAFAEVHARHPRAHLVLGGNGEVERARALVAEQGLQKAVTLAGWIDGDRKAALLRSAGIYVLPSYNEGLPMSVLEAMAWGLPVVTTRVGGIPELVTDGVDGLLIDAGDKAGLAAALSSLLTDERLRTRIAAAGRARIQAQYSDIVILPLLSRIYGECREGAASRSEVAAT
jgi:glycosyltransferase involved in cell wall biosynthesis